MTLFAIISFTSYFILHFIFLIGYFRSKSIKQTKIENYPNVTVIVAARNEEQIISNCISSLKEINYQHDLLEIILVNDKSTDNTKAIMLSDTANQPQFKVIDSETIIDSNLKGKANALNTAVKISKGDIILITDADCTVHPDWVKNTVSYFSNDAEMVCGFTKIKYNHSFFAKLQALDWIYLQSLASCSSGINMILSCIGNNISFTKKVYNEIGGYEKINFSVTEDLALMRRINIDYKINYPINSGCAVSTEECKTFKELYNQKKRWFKGGFEINFLGWILGVLMYSTNFFLLFGLLFLNQNIYLILLVLKIISDLLIILPVYVNLKFKNLIYYFIFFELYFAIYGIALPFTFIFGLKINWKEIKH